MAAVSSNSSTFSPELDVLLSTEVILPLSISMSKVGQTKRRRKKRSHGSKTVLSSVSIAGIIDFLGPILPFAGGIDLRRLHLQDIYEWMTSCWISPFGGESSSVRNIPRGGSISTVVSTINSSDMHVSLKNDLSDFCSRSRFNPNDKNRPLILGASEPFVSRDEIAELNLEEVAIIFQLSRSQTFNHAVFSGIRENALVLVRNVQEAAASSRGDGVYPASALEAGINGDIDASLLCAALRIFAEWRMLRTVPDGFKSYAVGMALGLKDVVQNIAKVEHVIREWIVKMSLESVHASEDPSGEHIVRGPTVRQLLEYERDSKIHPNLPRLNGGAAIGLLWSLRQLLYQSAVFQNILDTPNQYPDSKAAVGAAYAQVYNKYHGWAVQKIFNYSFKSAPEASLIFNLMDTSKLEELANEVSDIGSQHEDGESLATNITELSEFTGNNESAEVNSCFLADMAFWDATGAHANEKKRDSDTAKVDVGGKIVDWIDQLMRDASKVVDNIDKGFSKVGSMLLESQKIVAHWGDKKVLNGSESKEVAVSDEKSLKSVDGEYAQYERNDAYSISLDGPELEMYISQEMERHIRKQVLFYLKMMKPITFDLEELFEELNMNDPSKV